MLLSCTAAEYLRCAYNNRLKDRPVPRLVIMSASAELFNDYRNGLTVVNLLGGVTRPQIDTYLCFKSARVYCGAPQSRWNVDIHLID